MRKIPKKNNVMPFIGHIYEIRNRILYYLCSVLVFSILGYVSYLNFFSIISNVIDENLYVMKLTEGFLTKLGMSFRIGLFLSLPFGLIQLCLFFFPALEKKGKLYLSSIFIVSFGLFIIGVLYAYKSILPLSISFLNSNQFFPADVSRMISYKDYLRFILDFLIGFGLCFEIPVLIIVLLKFGLINQRVLLKNFKFVIILFFGISAILTPPDIVSQTLLAAPMIGLYAACLFIAKLLKLGDDS